MAELILDGVIAQESWWDDDVTPKLFKDELDAVNGDVVVRINSPGGDCIAASQIYTMLVEHEGKVTVKVDGIAASAASVIAMAGDNVVMSPTSMMMIHNPMTMAIGDHNDMEHAIKELDTVKKTIIKAYVLKTGLDEDEISELMEDETWMDVDTAIEYGFADEMLAKDAKENKVSNKINFSQRKSNLKLVALAQKKYEVQNNKENNSSVDKADEEEPINELVDATPYIKAHKSIGNIIN